MPEVQIRPAAATDIPIVTVIDHNCMSDYVWQMDIQNDESTVGAIFREIRLPRAVPITYPRPVSALAESWTRRTGMLVAVVEKQPIGYIRMSDISIPRTAWITDVVVSPRYRRQGIGTALILAVQTWALDKKDERAIMEMSSKNNAAIRLAQRLGYEFCGYNDLYYESQDIALFFGRTIR